MEKLNGALQLETRCISSLIKVFADEELLAAAVTRGSALLGESYSFQVAYRTDVLMRQLQVRVESELEQVLTVRTVELVPANMVSYHDADEYVLRSTPGLYPDALIPFDASRGLTGYPSQWRSLWITVEVPMDAKAGLFDIRIYLINDSGEQVGEETFTLEVIAAALPEQSLIHTEWFHVDCLATYYKTDVFSEYHWHLIEQYIQTAVKHGMNMILTPLFTPPLDTEIGGDRPTVQLVQVECVGDDYRFTFEKLKRWIALCDRSHVKYFEFSHLFTQWGAKHAPKVVATVDGQEKQLFGWDTDSKDSEYTEFLTLFLHELVSFIKENGLEKRVYFHLSDEPNLADMDTYRAASELIGPILEGFPIIDALSEYEFYESGLIKHPIPASNAIQPFLEHGVEGLWSYYCCAQYKLVSNRFLHMPSSRNRVLGMQLYKLKLAGFLHWGYNFWYAQFSKYPINPFQVTDAGGGFPAGDAFLVYPGAEGPIESIRLEVLTEALQDLRALELLERSTSREAVIALLEDGLEQELSFEAYPRETEWYIRKREEINRLIGEHAKAEQ
ncbi:hypothetical protein BK120_27375 [Paenibacillus sp. FSL A5-0031]|uniref:DUF4091 domain-containing protein n=1 Tax=Paenibacillus sp. FSL A5-0031 TaxID=1920420 RepID=UPI00096E8604|nr:DUF4091 domain-containing protein [Paenibacillus sp. FSL A5-0031]OME76871.1 hypothetical protein BK120_27375 [Paenibacillus sp. FSL A5-0031]